MKKVDVLKIKINAVRLDQAKTILLDLLKSNKKGLVCTPNTEFIIASRKDKEFRKILNSAALNLPDGFGLLWAAKFNSLNSPSIPIAREIIIFLQWIATIIMIPFFPSFFRHPIPQRISGSDFIWTIAELAKENHYRIFLLGGAPTVAERAALKLQTDIYGLKIAGVSSQDPSESAEIIQAVNKAKTDILLVGFGAPKQEKWLNENLEKTCAKVGMGIGGTYDFIAGIKKRAPAWMRSLGLEWLYRLIKEPTRLGRQMALPKLLIIILINKLFNRR